MFDFKKNICNQSNFDTSHIHVGAHSVKCYRYLCSDLDHQEFHLQCYLNQGKDFESGFNLCAVASKHLLDLTLYPSHDA